jgi:hypothetical protein
MTTTTATKSTNRLTYQGQGQAPTLVKLSQDFIAHLATGAQL